MRYRRMAAALIAALLLVPTPVYAWSSSEGDPARLETWRQGRYPGAAEIILKEGGGTLAHDGCGYFALTAMARKEGTDTRIEPTDLARFAAEMGMTNNWWGHFDFERVGELDLGLKLPSIREYHGAVRSTMAGQSYFWSMKNLSHQEQLQVVADLWGEGYYVLVCLANRNTKGHYVAVDYVDDEGNIRVFDSGFPGTWWKDSEPATIKYMIVLESKNGRPAPLQPSLYGGLDASSRAENAAAKRRREAVEQDRVETGAIEVEEINPEQVRPAAPARPDDAATGADKDTLKPEDVASAITPRVDPKKEVVAGANRTEVAVNVANAYFPDADTAILVNQKAYADALSAQNISFGKMPILYTTDRTLPESVARHLKEQGYRKVYLLGGSVSIAPSVEKAVKKALPQAEVLRVDGANRYAVNAKTLGLQSRPNGLITNGQNFPDALLASPLTTKLNAHLILVKPDRVPAEVQASLKKTKGSFTILGGEKSVLPKTEEEIEKMVGRTMAPRLAGRDRYTLSVNVMDAYFPGAVNVVATNGEVFSDALVAGPILQKTKRPLLLTKKKSVPPAVEEALSAARHMIVIGGANTLGK